MLLDGTINGTPDAVKSLQFRMRRQKEFTTVKVPAISFVLDGDSQLDRAQVGRTEIVLFIQAFKARQFISDSR